jgi:hypothetical protein
MTDADAALPNLVIELADTSHPHAEIERSNLDHSADPEKAVAGGGIRFSEERPNSARR